MKQRWTATTIAEALNLLSAATEQLESQALALEPSSDWGARQEAKKSPIYLTVEFDITDLIRRTTDRHAMAVQSDNG